MKILFKLLGMLFLFFCIGSIFSNNVTENISVESSYKHDSTDMFSQKEIDSASIILYTLTLKGNELLELENKYYDDSSTNASKISLVAADIQKYQVQYKSYIANIISNKLIREGEVDTIIKNARVVLNLIDSAEQKKNKTLIIEKERVGHKKEIDQIPTKRNKIQDSIKAVSEKISKKFSKLKSGGYSYKFFNKGMRFFISDSTYETKLIYNAKKAATNIEEVLHREKRQPEMITNAGMFEINYESVGYFVEKGIDKNKVDTISNKPGNFYLMPNGVFFIDTLGKTFIMETHEFINKKYNAAITKKPNSIIQYATQSGPMLIWKNAFNKNLKINSKNETIRSGVGQLKDGRCVYIKTDEPINFMDFAMVFKYFFNCESALYLDGAISKMYINEKNRKDTIVNDKGGQFGPMIVIYKK